MKPRMSSDQKAIRFTPNRMMKLSETASRTLTSPSGYAVQDPGRAKPMVTAPITSGASPRVSSWKAARPRSAAHQDSCTSTGRARSTAMSPVLIRSASSVQPKRATGASRAWPSHTYVDACCRS